MITKPQVIEAKNAIDNLINIGRVHFYKPIQIAEILYHSRVNKINTSSLENYRTRSRNWRDEISRKLVGNVSTSSSRYQDNIFDDNAIPPEKLRVLDEVNIENDGIVEIYIYQRLIEKWKGLVKLNEYIEPPFNFRRFINEFEENISIKRSVDKAYEIAVYVLFKIITKSLKVRISLSIEEPREDILNDFSDFMEKVLGVPKMSTQTTFSADIYRLGVANAADAGADVLTNFGPAIQVKHIRLSPDLARSATDPLDSNKIIIVCLEPERQTISSIIEQLGVKHKIQAIITDNDLEKWYDLATIKYRELMGEFLHETLREEFQREFPHILEIPKFIKERGYQRDKLSDIWTLGSSTPSKLI